MPDSSSSSDAGSASTSQLGDGHTALAEVLGLDEEIKTLKQAMEAEMFKLSHAYRAKMEEHIVRRAEVLSSEQDADAQAIASEVPTGTPAVPFFWRKALQNTPGVQDMIQPVDMPLLNMLTNITTTTKDESEALGFSLYFHFAPNSIIENSVLTKTYTVANTSNWLEYVNVEEVTATKIEWKEAQNFTVKVVQKKRKGGGAKKKNKPKEKDVPVPCFFRDFFHERLSEDVETQPEDVVEHVRRMVVGEVDPDEGEIDEKEVEEHMEEAFESLLSDDHDIGEVLRDSVIPFAGHFYNGEAAPEDSDDSDDDSDDEDSEMHDSDTEGSDAGDKKKKDEECKQQ